MNAETIAEDVALILVRLLTAIIDSPRDLNVDYRLHTRRVEFHVTPNINDQGKVVGKMGAHIKAIKFLAAQIGERQRHQVVIYLHEDERGERRPDPVRPAANPTYSCTAHKQLLTDILAAILDEEPEIEVVRDATGGSLLFDFVIKAKRIQDYERLVEADERENQSLITALGTLFRAAGHRDGVIFNLTVPSQ